MIRLRRWLPSSVAVGRLTSRITDPAKQLSPAQFRSVQAISDSLQSKYGVELAVYIDSPAASSPVAVAPAAAGQVRERAIQRFNNMHLGRADTNSGILISLDPAHRQVDIVTGDGLRKYFPDGLVNHCIQSRVIPEVRAHGVGAGAVESARACEDVLNERYTYDPNGAWVHQAAGGDGGNNYNSGNNSNGHGGGAFGRWGVLGATAAALAYQLWRQAEEEKRKRTCGACGREDMQPVAQDAVAASLSDTEQAEQAQGAVRFSRLQCPHCHWQSELWREEDKAVQRCSQCHARTVFPNAADSMGPLGMTCRQCGLRQPRQAPHQVQPTRNSSTSSSSSSSDNDGGGGFSSGGGATGKW